jgi:hypothetical protein
VPRRLNRITRIIVMVAGLVVIGGSAVGGIALAANGTDNSPSSVQPHATPTRSADDQGNNRGNDNESTEDRPGGNATPTMSTTCDRDADDVAGDRHGDPSAPDDDAVSGDRHGGDDSGSHQDGSDDCR